MGPTTWVHLLPTPPPPPPRLEPVVRHGTRLLETVCPPSFYFPQIVSEIATRPHATASSQMFLCHVTKQRLRARVMTRTLWKLRHRRKTNWSDRSSYRTAARSGQISGSDWRCTTRRSRGWTGRRPRSHTGTMSWTKPTTWTRIAFGCYLPAVTVCGATPTVIQRPHSSARAIHLVSTIFVFRHLRARREGRYHHWEPEGRYRCTKSIWR